MLPMQCARRSDARFVADGVAQHGTHAPCAALGADAPGGELRLLLSHCCHTAQFTGMPH